MLEFLHIENIAVIEMADIDFYNGFNVLTGETGAGKSIIIDSINAVLGARTSKDVIRSGCNTACVVAQFSDISDTTAQLLDMYGFSLDDGKIIIKRNLSSNSGSTFRINNIPANASTVKEIGKYLINIHGQHDNQALLDDVNHCFYIDRLANNKTLIDDYSKEFDKFVKYRKELKSLDTDDVTKQRKIDLLTYQINELEAADIKVGEYENLKEQLKTANNFDKIQKGLNNSKLILNGDENPGILENLEKVISLLNYDFTYKISEKINSALETLNDSATELENIINNQFSEPIDIEKIEDRLDLIGRLMLKYGNSEEKMLDFLENAKKELRNIEFSDERAEELALLLEESQERLIEKGERLTVSRTKAAQMFSKSVSNVLRYLDMPNIEFVAKITKGNYSKNGCDNVEFLISANSGEELKPLVKIASGGELSRIMLAIKSVLTDKDNVDTLIFDEIDTGISGQAAIKVAKKLKEISNCKQVVCVTHLSQIAAYADNHLLIKKDFEKGKTYTSVKSLDYEERIHELARIMSGFGITENLYNSAKELLDNSK